MYTVSEVSKITGVSIRALHHYDAIGLLEPTQVTGAGYRLYDDGALMRLQSILLFRELRFSLGEIKEMLQSPDFDVQAALKQQIELLEKERAHIEQLIACARTMQEKGTGAQMFEALDRTEMETYKAEAKERWGRTAAFQEYESRRKSPAELQAAGEGLMAFFAEMGGMKNMQPGDEAVQQKVEEMQGYITTHFYTCTKEILYSLGLMYTQSERFRRNIDKAGGEGTAAFVQKAIEIYCK